VTQALVRPGILYAWHGPSLLIVTARGDCADVEGLSGYYYREARFLRTWRLEINGDAPWLCESSAVAPDTLEFAYVYPEVAEYGGGGSGQSGDEEPVNRDGVPQRAIDIRMRYALVFNQLQVRATFGNRARRPLTFEVAWAFDADFADIQEAQSNKRQQTAPVDREANGTGVELAYRHDRLPYRTSIHLPDDWRAREGRITSRLTLEPGQTKDIMLRIEATDARVPVTAEEADERRTHLEQWRNGFTRVVVPGNRVFERALESNIRDVSSFPLLHGARDEWLALQAGVPLYPALFGRDAITAGWQVGCVDRGDTLDAALTRLGRLQSDRDDAWRDEEPGRIPYQVRSGPLAILDLNPYSAYYADFASPLMFVIALANLYAWTGEEDRVRRHWDTARRIMDWARERGDIDGDGYLEYRTRSSQGTKNQGWKDSGDAIIYADGTPVLPPIATCEIQGYWYAAQQLFGVLHTMLGADGDGRAYLAAAADLKKRFNRDWWVDSDSFVALAMDPDKRLVEEPSSNVGHCIAAGIVDADHLPPVVGRLFAPDMFSGWGIRTLSSNHSYYNPVSYHRGTVWAVEQATIVFGLRRFGFDARAHDLAGALFDLAQLYPEYRIPECVGGYARADYPTPGAYPQANTPQLWNASAFPLVVQTLLGLLPLAPYQTLVLDPALPEWLPDLVMHDLRVGDASVTVRVWRDASGESQFDVIRQRGTLRIIRQPPPESLFAGVGERVGGLVDTVLH
jgi:glycogen debranching enzyme